MSLPLSDYDPAIWDIIRYNTPDLYEYIEANGVEISDAVRSEIWDVIRKVMRPRMNMRVDQCADEFRYITRESSATPGKFDVSTYEVARGPLAAVTEIGVRKITAVGPTQLYKSTLLECTALYFAIVDPKPIILVQPCFKDAIDFMADKMKPMFNATPAVRQRVYHTTKTNVMFVGGQLSIASASSENSLASRLAGVMLFDEPAKYELLSGRHPVGYGEKRLETYGEFGKSIRASSPKTEDNFMWEQYLLGDRRQPYVECPHCGHDHVMRWKPTDGEKKRYLVKYGRPAPEFNVIWDIDHDTGDWDFGSARYVCPDCGVPWSYGDRLKALGKFKVKWRQTKPFTCCRDHADGGYQDPEETRHWTPIIDPSDGFEIVGRATCRVCDKLAVPNSHASFQASRLYSPKNLSLLVEKWKAALSTTGGIQDFVNDELGEPWKDYREIVLTADGLRAREEEYEFELPERAVVVTAGVDSHPDRFEVEIVAWGRNFENWTIDYLVIPGAPDDPATLAELDNVLMREFEGKDGRKQGIQAVCIDSGGKNKEGEVYTTRAVYTFSGQRQSRNVWAIKGAAEQGEVVYPAWPKTASTNNQYQVPLYTIGTTQLKNEVRSQLAVTQPGARYCHFQRGRESSWYTGMLGEKKQKVGSVWRWRAKDGARNEPFDCRVYALAALEGLKAKHRNPQLVEEIADKLGIGVKLTETEMERFDDDELERIAEETAKSLEQNRAKPITQRKKAKMPAREPLDEAKKEAPRPKISDTVAKIVPDELELQSPGQRDPSPRVSPARRRVPWDRS